MPWRKKSRRGSKANVYHADRECRNMQQSNGIRKTSYATAYAAHLRPCQTCKPRKATKADMEGSRAA